MASIKLTDIGATPTTSKTLDNGYVYKDLFLDLNVAYSYNTRLNRQESIKDVQALYDVNAVKNSVMNCFITSPGQKILNPEFGLDLRRYVFEAISDKFLEYHSLKDFKDHIQENNSKVEELSQRANKYIDECLSLV